MWMHRRLSKLRPAEGESVRTLRSLPPETVGAIAAFCGAIAGLKEVASQKKLPREPEAETSARVGARRNPLGTKVESRRGVSNKSKSIRKRLRSESSCRGTEITFARSYRVKRFRKSFAIIEKRMAEGVNGVPLSTEEIIRLGEIVATMATTLHEADKHHLAEVKKRKKRDLFAKREG